MKIILASKSPRRKELLSLITKEFEVIVSSSDEVVDASLTPFEQVKEIANQKAEDVFAGCEDDCIVIGSDTIVVSRSGEILGKPKDADDARRMLRMLSNDFHQVMTGIAVIIRKDGKVEKHIDCDIADVHIGELSEAEIERWLATGNAWDKAGAYAVQQEFGVHIDKIDGSYATVMGLPVHMVYQILKEYIF
ncbi:MAG: septum formation protein Maf [Clostridia bacterium]|nr:septum formation protein Maf [Clostridia bacterium]